MFCNYECVDAMTVGISDFEIKIMVFRVMRVCTFVGGYQHFEGNVEMLKLVPSSYSTQKVDAARFLRNIGRHL